MTKYLSPEQKQKLKALELEAESTTDKLATKAVASKYTSAIFLAVIIVALGIGATLPMWFD